MIRNTRGLDIGEAIKLLNESKKPVLSRKRPVREARGLGPRKKFSSPEDCCEYYFDYTANRFNEKQLGQYQTLDKLKRLMQAEGLVYYDTTPGVEFDVGYEDAPEDVLNAEFIYDNKWIILLSIDANGDITNAGCVDDPDDVDDALAELAEFRTSR